ncbi:hypothetical protein VA249_29900 [Vibrio alfacsensis]|nr:hypothetical protein VA249_29900 [Vibrio alfacsensis]
MSHIAALLTRLGKAVLNQLNRNKAKEYADDPATAIAHSDERVRQSETSFAELARESKSDRTE